MRHGEWGNVSRQVATYRLLAKFHKETPCGTFPGHWAECERLCDYWGYESWEAWQADQAEHGLGVLARAVSKLP